MRCSIRPVHAEAEVRCLCLDRTSNECPQRVHFCETFGGVSVDFEKLNFGLQSVDGEGF